MLEQLITDYAEKIVLALLVVCVFTFTGWVLSLVLRRVGKSKSLQANRVYRLMAGSINTVITGAGVITALGTLGVNITALVAGLGLTGFALGMALKDAIANLVAGLMIIVYTPFDLGDTVELSGSRGRVVDMNLRYVTLQTETECVLIPNSNFVTSVIKKETANPSGVPGEARP